MGLLDIFNTEQGRMGLGLLAAGSARGDGAGFGQRLSEAVGSVDQWKQQQAQAKRAKMQEEFQAFQMQQAMAQAEQQKAEQARQQTIRQGMGGFFKPGQQAISPLMGNAETGIMPSAGRAAVAPSFDAAGAAQFLAQNGEYDKALPMLQSLNKQSEFDPEVRYDQKGRAFMTAKDGSVKFLDGISARDKLIESDLGGTKGFRTEYSADMLASLPKTMTFADKNAAANLELSRKRFDFDQRGGAEGGKPQLVDGQWVYKPDANNPQGRVVPVAGLADKPLTDSQGKANLFGTRMIEAEKVLQSVVDKADRPGWMKRTAQTTVGLVPFAGDKLSEVAGSALNFTQSAAQQQVEQAKEDFINALMRRESGAVIGRDEFSNADRQYFPQVGDSDAKIAQKARNRQTAISGIMAEVPKSRNQNKPTEPQSGQFSDPAKESRYQAWKSQNGGM